MFEVSYFYGEKREMIDNGGLIGNEERRCAVSLEEYFKQAIARREAKLLKSGTTVNRAKK
jgi:hypothetical protein